MATEADTCRKYVVPKLIEAGWDEEPHSIAEQRRIVAYLDNLQVKMDRLKQIQTQPKLDALLPSILDKAFKGEL